MCIYTLTDLVLIWIDDLFDDELLKFAGQTSFKAGYKSPMASPSQVIWPREKLMASPSQVQVIQQYLMASPSQVKVIRQNLMASHSPSRQSREKLMASHSPSRLVA